ncbi:MAG TPA: hypothetical protein VLO09_04115 [Ornithinimicrobium sp.]|nr:hypothetical protein [Ornithinimicrobium sp.]
MSVLLPFVTLTDVELALVEEAHLRLLGGGRADPGPTPVEEHARRSLRARGLLTDDGELATGTGAETGTELGSGGPDLAGAVGLALDVRLAADVVVVAQRVVGRVVQGRDEDPAPQAGTPTAGRGASGDDVQHLRSARVLHLVAEGACVEDVDEEGLHALSLTTDPVQAARSVEEALLPPDAVDGRGDPVRAAPAGLDRLAEALGRPTVLAELTVVAPGDGADAGDDGAGTGRSSSTGVLLALGPGGCWAGAATPGDDGRFTFHPVPRRWLGDRARLTVDAVMGSGSTDPAEGTMGR